MAQRLDYADITAMVDKLKSECASHLTHDGHCGAYARYIHQVAEAMLQWRALEINRGTEPVHVAETMLEVFRDTIVGHIRQSVDPENAESVVIELGAEFVAGALRDLEAAGAHQYWIVPKEIGTA